MDQLRLVGFPEVEPPAPELEAETWPEPTPIPVAYRRADTRPLPPLRRDGWQQSALELEFGPSPIPPDFEARLQIRMLVSGRIRCRTFLAWLAASGHRLARLPRGHEVHRILDVLAPELATRRPPAPHHLVARLEEAGLHELALAAPAPY
jgi:hypothetical protein